MKKSSFIQGAVVATSAIVITKIIGVIYVIPFYSLIGEQGGALYSYAYSLYNMFLNISISGIPFAISKITSEYNSQKKYYLKEKAFKTGKYLIGGIGILSFLILFFFSNQIAYLFVGDFQGGNTKESVSIVIKVVSSALLIVPLLSVSRGYLQGHKFIAPSSTSQVIEQLVRVLFLLLGTFLALKIFNISLTGAVSIAVFSATIGAAVAYIFLKRKINKHKNEFESSLKETKEDKKVTYKVLLKKIIFIAVPFVLLDMIRSLYNVVDLVVINRTMISLGYTLQDSEAIIGVLSTWGAKLNSIIYAISTGLIVSLIPNIASSHALKDKEDIKDKTNKALQSLLFVVIPATVGLSFLAKPVWIVMFGDTGSIGPMVFSYSVFTALVVCVTNVTSSVLHSMSKSRKVIFSILTGLFIKIVLTIPLMKFLNQLGFHPSVGITTSTIIGFTICFGLNLYNIKKETNINYKITFIRMLKIILNTVIMLLILLGLSYVIPTEGLSRIGYLLTSMLYGIVGAFIYIVLSHFNKTVYDIFGKDIKEKILKKIKK